MIFLSYAMVGTTPTFILKSEPYQDLTSHLQKMKGAVHRKALKQWELPAYLPFGLQVVSDLKMLFVNMILELSAIKRVEALTLLLDKATKFRIDERFTYKYPPQKHQTEALSYAITHPRVGIFYECGLGKTKIATDIIRYVRRNTLFLCPAQLVENTAEELYKHSFEGELCVHPISASSKAKKTEQVQNAINATENAFNVVLVMGYESVYNYKELIATFPYHILICDESHKLRSHNSKVSASVEKLAQASHRRVLMTGTPSLGNPLHLFMQLRILAPHHYPNFWQFQATFTTRAPNNHHIIVGYKNLHVLNKLVTTVSRYRRKEDCLDLPERTVIKVPLRMNATQRKLYLEVLKGLHTSVAYNPIMILKMIKMQQLCGGTLVESPIDDSFCNGCQKVIECVEKEVSPFSKRCIRPQSDRPVTNTILEHNPKRDYLLELLSTIIAGQGQKVIVWYRFANERTILLEALKSYGVVDYSTDRQEGVTKFNTDPTAMIFLAQIQSGIGITLNSASYTIYYSFTYNAENYWQSRDRNYRIGQTQKVMEYHLLMEHSMDEIIADSLEKKQDVNFALLLQKLLEKPITTLSRK
jgi:SNF2 family DNA or RNA helicase